nr:hypothetical protein [uncultured Acetatifactor sp.]
MVCGYCPGDGQRYLIGHVGRFFDDISKSMAISAEFARDSAKMDGSVSA